MLSKQMERACPPVAEARAQKRVGRQGERVLMADRQKRKSEESLLVGKERRKAKGGEQLQALAHPTCGADWLWCFCLLPVDFNAAASLHHHRQREEGQQRSCTVLRMPGEQGHKERLAD